MQWPTGSCLQGFEPGDLYALFANALDYAIEGAVRTPDPARRNIDLLVCVRQSFIVINVISPTREPEAAATPYRGLRAESAPPHRAEIQWHPDHGNAERLFCHQDHFPAEAGRIKQK